MTRTYSTQIEAARMGIVTPELEQAGRMGGYVTYSGKQCTEYSIANGAVEVIKAIVHDTKLITPLHSSLGHRARLCLREKKKKKKKKKTWYYTGF